MAIYLIRHAQSVGNIDGQTDSHASIELTELGHQQAEKLAEVLPQANKIMISPYLRTLQTAQPLLNRDGLEAEILQIQEFSYLSDLKCKGTTLSQRKPWVDAYWQGLDVDYLDEEDAETFRNFYQRVQALRHLLKTIQADYQTENLMIFSHGQFPQLFKMLSEKDSALSADLMHEFRQNMLHQPIENTEFMIYG